MEKETDKKNTFFVYFAQFFPRTNFAGGAFEDLSAWAKICQLATLTILTCRNKQFVWK